MQFLKKIVYFLSFFFFFFYESFNLNLEKKNFFTVKKSFDVKERGIANVFKFFFFLPRQMEDGSSIFNKSYNGLLPDSEKR